MLNGSEVQGQANLPPPLLPTGWGLSVLDSRSGRGGNDVVFVEILLHFSCFLDEYETKGFKIFYLSA
jgi:hypothetical protein